MKVLTDEDLSDTVVIKDSKLEAKWVHKEGRTIEAEKIQNLVFSRMKNSSIEDFVCVGVTAK